MNNVLTQEKAIKNMSLERKLRLTWQLFELGRKLDKLKEKRNERNSNTGATFNRNRKNS